MSDPFSPLRIVSVADSALDADSMGPDLAEYARTRDEALLKFKLGQKPAWATVRGMTASYLLDVVYPANPKTQAGLALLASVHEIELPDGRKLTPRKLEQSAYRQQVATEEWLDTVRGALGMGTMLEFGRVAIKRAELPDGARGPFV